MLTQLIVCTACTQQRNTRTRRPVPATTIGKYTDMESGAEYDVHACGVHGRPLKVGHLLSLTNGDALALANGNGHRNAHAHRNGHAHAHDAEAARLKRNEKQRRYRETHPRADRKAQPPEHVANRRRRSRVVDPAHPGETAHERKKRLDRDRYHAKHAGAPKRKPGRPPKHSNAKALTTANSTPEERRAAKLKRQRDRRSGGYGNKMHILRDGSRVLLKGPPFKCSCGKDADGKPGGFRLMRNLTRHANKQASLGHAKEHVVGKPVPA